MITGIILGKTYVVNGKSVDVSEFIPDMSADIYYEVVRLMNGKALFLEDHLNRLRDSISGTDMQLPGSGEIIQSLRVLISNNDFKIGNIRICFQTSKENQSQLLCYFVPYVYPESCVYLSGVQLVTYPHVRRNPGIKKWDDQFRVSVNKYIRDHGVYEALLLNNQKQITEGSRSNVFFVDKHQELISPPHKDILPGITRKYVIEIGRQKGVPLVERPVTRNELDQMESCFITGTSPKVLPVWQIDGTQFKVDHPLIRILMEEFELLIQNNLTPLSGNSGII
jgi:branched-chain amino acid aminotransferase